MKKMFLLFLLLSVLVGCSDEPEQESSGMVDLADTARLHAINKTANSNVVVDTVTLKKLPDSAKKRYLKEKRIERNEARMKAMQERQ